MLEAGEFATIAELAEREGIAPSYMTRVLRLTLLAPDIVEAILDGKQGSEVTLARVLEPFPVEWAAQSFKNVFTPDSYPSPDGVAFPYRKRLPGERNQWNVA